MHLCGCLPIYKPFFCRALLWQQSPNRDGARCCSSRVHNAIMGPCRTNCFSCTFCITSSSYAGLVWYPYFLWIGLKGNTGGSTYWLREAGRWGPALHQESGLKVSAAFRRRTWGGRFHQELWGLPANVTACWTSREHCIPEQPCLHSAWTAEPWAAGGHAWTGASLPLTQACSDPTHDTWDNARTLSDNPMRSGLVSGESRAAARRQQLPIAFCAFLIIKRQLFALLFIFSEVFIWDTCCI